MDMDMGKEKERRGGGKKEKKKGCYFWYYFTRVLHDACARFWI